MITLQYVSDLPPESDFLHDYTVKLSEDSTTTEVCEAFLVFLDELGYMNDIELTIRGGMGGDVKLTNHPHK